MQCSKEHRYSITSCQKATNCSAASFEGNKNSIAAVSPPRPRRNDAYAFQTVNVFELKVPK